ncbi:carbohydrate ABC transporter permease [Bauldia sp.]|uniref:carbohydrate ABC transporter permease n=1 Tax=Bauldia sp. TaxID=2575872 RepID=UPI003BA9D072
MKRTLTAWTIVMRVTLAVGLLVVTVVVLFPFAYAAIFSFAPISQIFSLEPRLVPAEFTIDNYVEALWGTNFLIYLRNSMIVSLTTVLLSVTIGALGGYALGCLQVRGRGMFSMMFLLVYLLPNVLFLVPLYLLIVRMGIADTLLSLIVSYTTFAIPFTTWTLRAFFVGIPRDLPEAAKVDGCSEFGAFVRVVLPLAAPGIATAAVFAFILAWNELLFALTFVSSDTSKVITVGISAVLGQWSTQVGVLLAFTVLAGLPVLIFFVLLNKFLIRGLTAGSVKG